MVVSLFPKRRRRRRWHGLPSEEIVEPPSFSEIQPEITVREDTTWVPEVSVDVRTTPATRSRRKSTIGTPALRELPANQLASLDEGHSGTSKSSCDVLGTTSISRRRTSERRYLDVPDIAVNPSPRRSSRLLENCNPNLNASSSSLPETESSKVSRRVSFSLSKGRSSTLCREKDHDSVLTEKFSAREENSDYRAFMNGILDAALTKNSTICSRASMTNPCADSQVSVSTQAETEEPQVPDAETPDVHTAAEQLEGRLVELPQILPEETAPSLSKVMAPTISRTELKTVPKPRKVKPELCDARTSTTGLDQFVKSSRRKKSMCVQIDLDRTTAFGSVHANRSQADDVQVSCSSQAGDVGTQSPKELQRAELDHNTSMTERVVLRGISCVGDISEPLRPETPPEELRPSCEKRLLSETLRPCTELQIVSVKEEDMSCPRPGALLKPKSGNREPEALAEGEPTTAESRLTETERTSPASKDDPSALSNPMESVNDLAGAEKLDEFKVPAPVASKTHSEPLAGAAERSSSSSTDFSRICFPTTKPPEDTPTSRNPSSLSLRGVRPKSSDHGGIYVTPTAAKRSRAPHVTKPAKRRSTEMDIIGIAQRIKMKIERKRLIENTIYRRVNLIYEGLWEEFLQTYYPQKWAKVKDVWMTRKAEKRLEEEQRGLGDLDDEMEREVKRGTELGAAKYIKEFEEKRAKERRRKFTDGKTPRKAAEQILFPQREEMRSRKSRRLRDLEPL